MNKILCFTLEPRAEDNAKDPANFHHYDCSVLHQDRAFLSYDILLLTQDKSLGFRASASFAPYLHTTFWLMGRYDIKEYGHKEHKIDESLNSVVQALNSMEELKIIGLPKRFKALKDMSFQPYTKYDS